MLEFMFKAEKSGSLYYRCKRCHAKKIHDNNLSTVPSISIRNGVIITDPDFPSNPHYCDPISKSTAVAQQIDRDTRENIRVTGKRPRVAYNDALADIPRKLARMDEAERTEIEQRMPDFRSVARAYQRTRRAGIPAVPDV
ncbi:MAG: hypothetical protein GY696_33240 [Gammaproteobacteria bacterium]|nr:hypothetical protein [Gammaproteobacteria bacterium]